MYTKRNFYSMLRTMMFSALMCIAFAGIAQVNTYDVADLGYLRKPMESKSGLVLTNNRYSEIYLLQDGQLKTLVKGRGAGIYTQMSKDKTLVGFKSINDDDYQAPAVLHVASGVVNILEDYVWECGQVSFADDGTMAYTMGNNLVIRKGSDRKTYDLGFYTNIVNISPDAKRVAYGNIDGGYFIMNLETGVVEQVAVNDGYDGVWSPDGSKLAIHTATGRLSVLEKASNRIYDLGEGSSASWANNSQELVYTVVDREKDLMVKGAGVYKSNFDGSNRVALIESNEDMPIDAIVTSDNKMVVPYAGELKRCLAIRPVPTTNVSGVASLAGAAQEKVVYDIIDGEFGDRLGNYDKNAIKSNGSLKNVKGKSSVQMEGTIGASDIPYLSQIYDSPAVNGCTAHGYVTCAPTSACMHLGYYDLLPKKATKNRYSGETKQYAHAISAVYTNKKGTRTFSETAYGNGCYSVPGGYGYMWYGDRSPANNMGDFYKLNGASGYTYTWSSSTAWSHFKTKAAAGDAYPMCIELYSSGHLILGYRTNCTYSSSDGWVNKTGSFVCHDPYGDANYSPWAGNDGYYSSYDWPGYNNGRVNIFTLYWGIKVDWPAGTTPGGTPAEQPSLKCNPMTVEFSGEVGSTTETYKDVKVTGTGLSSNIIFNSATSSVIVEKLSGWDDLKGGTLRFKLNTNFSKGAGYYESYVAVQSTSDYRVKVVTKVTLTDPNAGNEDPGETPAEPTPDPTPSTPADPGESYSKGLTKVWQNTTSVPGVATGGDVRYIAVVDGKMIANDKAAGKIIEIKENGVADYKDMTGTTIGTGISADDAGNIIVNTSFSKSGSGQNFVIISKDLSKTYPIDLSSISGYTATRTDQIGRVRGNMLSAEGGYFTILPNTSANAVVVKVANGALADSKLVALGFDNSQTATNSDIAQPAYEKVADMASNMGKSFVVRRRGLPTSVYTWTSGSFATTKFDNKTSEGYTTTNAGVDGFDWFKLGGKSYYIMPVNVDGTTESRGTHFAIYDQDGNVAASWVTGQKSGLGAIMGSFVAVPADDFSVYIYHFVPGVVAEKLRFAIQDVLSGIESVELEEVEAPVEYYNLQGVRVMNPENGLYIKRQGNKVTKVIL